MKILRHLAPAHPTYLFIFPGHSGRFQVQEMAFQAPVLLQASAWVVSFFLASEFYLPSGKPPSPQVFNDAPILFCPSYYSFLQYQILLFQRITNFVII